MTEPYQIVDFHNAQNPDSEFDMLPLRSMLDRDYDNHSPYALHQVQFFTILLFTGGVGSHTIDFVDYPCERGTLLVIRKDQIHKFSKSIHDGVILLFTLEFLGNFYAKTEGQKSLLLFNEFLNSPIFKLTESQLTMVIQLIDRLNYEYLNLSDHLSPSIIRSELQILISKLYRLKSTHNESESSKKYLSKFIRFHKSVEENFSKSLKVMDYAKWLAVSTKTLNTITQAIVQKSAKEFIDEVCINHIKRQLINSEKTIKEICYDSGLQETSNFSTYFKKRVGVTPEVYRRNKR